jgi:predicted membrane-bound mannosyltransferase
MLLRLLIPLALAAAVVVSAVTTQGRHQRAKPAPARVLQLHH